MEVEHITTYSQGMTPDEASFLPVYSLTLNLNPELDSFICHSFIDEPFAMC